MERVWLDLIMQCKEAMFYGSNNIKTTDSSVDFIGIYCANHSFTSLFKK